MKKTPQSKSHEKTLADVMRDRENLLDKVSRLLYNTLRKTDEMNVIDPVDKLSVDKGRTKYVAEKIEFVHDRVNEILDKEYGLSAVVAGGAVRDALLGFLPRDIDVFVLGKTPDEDLDDLLVYTSELFRESMPKDEYSCTMAYPLRFRNGYSGLSEDFAVREFTYQRLDSLQREAVQLIARKDCEINSLLESFDYELVKCYYDGKFKVSDSFLEALSKKRIQPRDQKTASRIHEWRDRTGFKITIGRLPKAAQNPMAEEILPTIPTGIYDWAQAGIQQFNGIEIRPGGLRLEMD